MFSLSPEDRQRTVQEQQVKQRTTRQNDLKKRQTNNSRDDKILLQLNDASLKKKVKLSSANDEKKNSSITTNGNNEAKKQDTNTSTLISDDLSKANKPNAIKSTIDDTKKNSTIPLHSSKSMHSESNEQLHEKENQGTVKYEFPSINHSKSGSTLGIGHLSVIHAFTRDYLFKKIKIVTNNHLETNGYIMKKVLEKLNYSEKTNGNYIAFTNAVRTEIRKTICSRRGYVKRQIGILIKGKIFVESLKLIDSFSIRFNNIIK